MIEKADSERNRIIPKTEMISVEAAIDVISNWWNKSPSFNWEKTPAWVILKLLEVADDDMNVTYDKAVSILKEAETTHMLANANKGIRFIKDEWKKLYL